MAIHSGASDSIKEYAVLLRPGFRLADLVRVLEWMEARKSVIESRINWTICSIDGGLVRGNDGMLLMAPTALESVLDSHIGLLVISGADNPEFDYQLLHSLQQRGRSPLLWLGASLYQSDYYLFQESACRDKLDEIMVRIFMADLSVEQGDALLARLEVAPVRLSLCDSRVQRALAMMRRDIDQPLDRERISREACVSVRQLERLFQKYFEATPGKYFTRMKMDLARTCLQLGDGNVTDIAYRLGFNSVSHFSRLYKTEFGVAPGRTPVII
ncbi:helix-turn-helix domain-containing protein [Oceanobacter mangrovi]|uniref:helix-turn-helix domain-containing protein n=1 Tax=Oceanobacter mangrovi TaxID=2862510 RepID=UPI001C8DC618|nr:helix-turn-helix domain-containing protein [Oceanobacter mangrovi]